MNNFFISKREWRLKLLRGKGLIAVMIPYLGKELLFTEILAKMFLGKPNLALSQFVDIDQWSIGDRHQFADRIATQFSVDLSFTSSFIEERLPQIGQKVFILNGISSPRIEFLNQVLHFGMTNLPNIVYEYKEDVSGWLPRIMNWNKVILDWHQFKTPDNSLVEIANQTGLISWTSDYHLSFCITEINQLTRLLDILEDLSRTNKFSMIIETEKIDPP